MSEETVRPALSQAASPPSAPILPAAKGPSLHLRWALILALFGLGITMWHFIASSDLAFTAFMILGQGSFAAAMALYGWVIFRDLRHRRVL